MINTFLENYTKFHSPGYAINIYNNGEEKELVYGNRQVIPTILPCDSQTLYDIASLTKVYTAVLIYMAYEEHKLDIYDNVINIDSRFKNLKDIRIIDLLSHNQEIWTDGYLGKAKDKDEFYSILFSASVKSKIPTYVDSHYIILSTILEKIYNKSYDKILQEKIFDTLGLKSTTVNPNSDNIASNNYEKLDDKIVDYVVPGVVHDTKARTAKKIGITTGHASIFTTGHELMIFLKSFINYTLLKKETINLMLEHTDRNNMNINILKGIVKVDDINKAYYEALKLKDNIQLVKTYNNMGTRYHNIIEDLNDVPNICGKNSIVFSGFTGPMFMIDFDKKIIVTIMCNVMHGTNINRIERKKATESIMNEICNNIYKNLKK